MGCILLNGGRRLPWRRVRRACVGVAVTLATAAPAAHGDETPPAAGDDPAASSSGDAQAPATVAPPGDANPAPRRFRYEAAIGAVLALGPGDTTRVSGKFTPGVFIRWDRWTLTNQSGFVTRREDVEVRPGLSGELLSADKWRVNAGLRLDRGREASDSDTLAGRQAVRATLRGRLTVTRDFGDSLSAVMNTSADLLGHDGGVLADLSLNKTFPIGPKAWWGAGVGVSAADERYMRSYYGTSQTATTPAYTPGAGWRDASFGLSLRGEIGERWIGFVGAGYSVLLGPARASPGVRPTGWGVNGGLAWRFWW